MLVVRWPVAVGMVALSLIATPAIGQSQFEDRQAAQGQQGPSLPGSIVNASEMTDQRRQQVQQYIRTAYQNLTAKDDQAVTRGRSLLLEPVSDRTSDAFINYYGQQLFQGLSQVMSQARPFVRLNAMIVAARFQQPAVLKLAQQGLTDEAPAVRYWAGKIVQNHAQQADGVPEAQREPLLKALSAAIDGEVDPIVVKAAMLALAAIPGGNADARLLSTLNNRVALHARNPRVGYVAEQDALQTLYSNVSQRVANNQGSDQAVRTLARIAFRYKALIAAQQQARQKTQAGGQANGAANGNDSGGIGNNDGNSGDSEESGQNHARMAKLSDKVLQWSFNQLSTSGSIPTSLKGWRQQLTQAPYNFSAQELAVPKASA